MRIYGINPVLEALRAGRVTAIHLSSRGDARVSEIVRIAEASGVSITRASGDAIDRLVSGGRHQGVVAETRDRETLDVSDLLAGAAGAPLLVVLDQIEDPHNVGAILRTVEAAGGDGVIQQSRRAARLDGAVAKSSAGALAHVRVAEVVNIARALEELKEAGVWTVGLAGEGETRYDEVDLTLPTALVIGGEGAGLRRLVRERCDWLVSIPLRGHVQSLNASVAAGIALFEAVRQRRTGRSPAGTGLPKKKPAQP